MQPNQVQAPELRLNSKCKSPTPILRQEDPEVGNVPSAGDGAEFNGVEGPAHLTL